MVQNPVIEVGSYVVKSPLHNQRWQHLYQVVGFGVYHTLICPAPCYYLSELLSSTQNIQILYGEGRLGIDTFSGTCLNPQATRRAIWLQYSAPLVKLPPYIGTIYEPIVKERMMKGV